MSFQSAYDVDSKCICMFKQYQLTYSTKEQTYG